MNTNNQNNVKNVYKNRKKVTVNKTFVMKPKASDQKGSPDDQPMSKEYDSSSNSGEPVTDGKLPGDQKSPPPKGKPGSHPDAYNAAPKSKHIDKKMFSAVITPEFKPTEAHELEKTTEKVVYPTAPVKQSVGAFTVRTTVAGEIFDMILPQLAMFRNPMVDMQLPIDTPGIRDPLKRFFFLVTACNVFRSLHPDIKARWKGFDAICETVQTYGLPLPLHGPASLFGDVHIQGDSRITMAGGMHQVFSLIFASRFNQLHNHAAVRTEIVDQFNNADQMPKRIDLMIRNPITQQNQSVSCFGYVHGFARLLLNQLFVGGIGVNTARLLRLNNTPVDIDHLAPLGFEHPGVAIAALDVNALIAESLAILRAYTAVCSKLAFAIEMKPPLRLVGSGVPAQTVRRIAGEHGESPFMLRNYDFIIGSALNLGHWALNTTCFKLSVETTPDERIAKKVNDILFK